MAIVGRFSELENTVEQRSIMVVYNDDKTLSGHYATSGKELWRTPIKQFGNLVINTTEEFVFGTAEGGRIFFALEKSRF
jgi:hypothetical protein